MEKSRLVSNVNQYVFINRRSFRKSPVNSIIITVMIIIIMIKLLSENVRNYSESLLGTFCLCYRI